MNTRFPWIAVLLICSFSPWVSAAQEEPVVEMKVRRVVLDPYSKTPVVILESADKKEPLPIWIGGEEATSIALELEKVAAPRPNTHDLIRNILNGVGAAVQRITITDLRNNVYYASIALRLRGQDYQIDSRPSDAIAVALRMKAPIYATTKVLAKAQPLPVKEKQDRLRKLGIQAQDLTAELASLLDLTAKSGVLVADVEMGSPAAEAGVQRGDIILKANNEPLQKAAELEAFLEGDSKASPLKIELLRKGKTVALELGYQPPPSQEKSP
ncbi:MAG: hypothetical protein A3F90_16295 [Deltaproteobacteria bacterium RIFCSPLOWO2_12_FULL_60_19]|nr:MAG: hypothetical protein A3F90_16295 [Deltaproteobacteria bacterium RIFCSPLOWO2_12_FULL_60_19]